MTLEKRRNSSIELFRIITMLLIVASHYVVNSGLMVPIRNDPTSVRSLLYLVFGAWGKTGINCFVLITGYFMCVSQLTARRYLKLLLEIYFYRFTIYFIFIIFGLQSFSVKSVLMMCLPFSSIADGFTSCFMAFYLFIPFLNLAIKAFNQKQHLALVGLLILVYTIWATIPGIHVVVNYLSWFIVLYFIGAYLRLYDPKIIKEHALAKLLVTFCLAVVSFVFLVFYSVKAGRELYAAYYLISDVNKPFALLIAVFAFSFFSHLNLSYKPWINTIAASTFGVFLIHTHSDAMRHWLWNRVLHNQEMYSSPWAVLHAFGSVVAVFTVCVLIDMVRIRFLEKPLFRYYDRNEKRFFNFILK